MTNRMQKNEERREAYRKVKKDTETYAAWRSDDFRPDQSTREAVFRKEREMESLDRGAKKMGYRDYDAMRRESGAS